jgi:hypothetical protein
MSVIINEMVSHSWVHKLLPWQFTYSHFTYMPFHLSQFYLCQFAYSSFVALPARHFTYLSFRLLQFTLLHSLILLQLTHVLVFTSPMKNTNNYTVWRWPNHCGEFCCAILKPKWNNQPNLMKNWSTNLNQWKVNVCILIFLHLSKSMHKYETLPSKYIDYVLTYFMYNGFCACR